MDARHARLIVGGPVDLVGQLYHGVIRYRVPPVEEAVAHAADRRVLPGRPISQVDERAYEGQDLAALVNAIMDKSRLFALRSLRDTLK